MYGNSLIHDRFFPNFYKFATVFLSKMKYIQVTFTVAPDTQDVRDILVALAGCNGFESFTEEDNELIGYCQESVFNLHSLKKILDEFPIPNIQITYSINKIEDKNWNEEWEKNGFNPIVIDNRCAVICKNTMESQSVQTLIAKIPMKVIIDAQQSFGTGTHETTQMIVSLLLNQDMQGKRVLDCGCGTGILGIVAAKCGAQDIVCYDIDDWSVRNTKHNAELNNVKLDILEGDKNVLSHVNGIFDLVLANINRNIILEDLETFYSVMSDDAKIILSGFYEQDSEVILQQAIRLGLKESQQLLNQNWCCLLLEKA